MSFLDLASFRANFIVRRRIERIERMERAGIITKAQADAILSDVDWAKLAQTVRDDIQDGAPVPSRT